jgi:hypothetical protein
VAWVSPGERNEPVKRAAEVGVSYSTREVGELVPRGPGRGKGTPGGGTGDGEHVGDTEPQQRVQRTPSGSAAHASPPPDEPDALIAQVRICGSRGERSPRRPGDQEMEQLDLKRDPFHGEWNYRLIPR